MKSFFAHFKADKVLFHETQEIETHAEVLYVYALIGRHLYRDYV